jgi:hypothetical protein
LGGRYDVGLDNRIMPEVAARVLRCRLQPRKITPAVRVLQEAQTFHALNGIDLHLPTQRVTAFRGPSGSGKTTLLSIIGCLSRPTSGRVRLGDRDISGLPERFLTHIRRQTFGFIFQQFNLIKGLSALENVMLPAYPLGGNWRALHERAESLLGESAPGASVCGRHRAPVGWRAATRGDRPGADQRPADHHRRRADRQPRHRAGHGVHGHPREAPRPSARR